jgi:lipid-A-disaccharide synthase
MQAEGLKTLFPQSDLSHLGLIELLPKIPHILRRLDETAEAVRTAKPVAVITIDGPDFNFRLAKKLQGSGIPLIHYVAPTVWAWRKGRARKIARLYNHLFALLPFEPPYFTKEKLACTYIGNAVVESGAESASAARFRAFAQIPEDKKILTFLPGSRAGEIRRFMPMFGKTLEYLKDRLGDVVVVIPTLPHLQEIIRPYAERWPVKPLLVLDYDQKYNAYAASHVALAVSGTVALELALTNTPNVTACRINMLTAFLFMWFVRVKFVNLVNILLNRPAVPELIQLDCTPKKLADAVYRLWSDDAARRAQQAAFAEIRKMVHAGSEGPSDMAARIVCEMTHAQAA